MFQSNRSFYTIIYGFITKVFARFISKVVSNISRITIVFCLYFLVNENFMYIIVALIRNLIMICFSL